MKDEGDDVIRKVVLLLLTASVLMSQTLAAANGSTKTLPEGTRIYFRLDKHVSGKRGQAQEGEIVPCSVWRDVDLQGIVLVKAGTLGTCKIESVKHANIAGIKRKVVIGALDTRTIDGQPLQLTGGYNKEGKSRMALSISLGALVFLPLIFITGSPADLPEGTVFDAYSGPDMPVAIPVTASSVPVITLGGGLAPMTAEVILDDFMQLGSKPDVFKIHVVKNGPLPKQLVIDSVNGKSIAALPLTILESKSGGEVSDAVATIEIKTLAKHFQKGINHFDVAYTENGERTAVEVILNIQM